MNPTPDDARQRMQRVETLIQQVSKLAEPARAQVQELVQALLDLHGAGLQTMLGHLAAAGPAGLGHIDALADDDLVGSLFLLYGLHPLDVEGRVRRALDKAAPMLKTHGGAVEFVAIAGDSVRLRLQGNCDGCTSSAGTLRQIIEEAIFDKAPEVTAIEIDGLSELAALDAAADRKALPMVTA